MNKKPNIIIIMTDQHRADQSKREGFPLDTTPFLDAFATKGTWFNHAYTSAPLCVPARMSLLTGRYPSAHRVVVNHGLKNAIYDKNLFDIVKQQGYCTAIIGKNHSDMKRSNVDYWFAVGHTGGDIDIETEEEKSFKKWLGTTRGVGMEPTPFPIELQGPHRIVSSAIEWVGSMKDKPFFLWLSIPEPHTPNQVPEPYFSMFPPETLPAVRAGNDVLERKSFKYKWIKALAQKAYQDLDYDEVLARMRSNYLGMLRLIDDQIKRFIKYMKDKGLFENTIFVFLADHGDFVGEYGLMRKGPELPEVLTRIPMFFVGPDIKASAAPSSAYVSITDIMPTICEVLGTPLPHGVQGRSLWPILTGSSYPHEEFESAYMEQGFGGLHYTEEEVDFSPTYGFSLNRLGFDGLNSCTQSGTMRALCKNGWKLILDMRGNGQLYHLSEDPSEQINLYGKKEYQHIQCQLTADLASWMMRVQDPLMLPKEGKYIMKCDPRNYWSQY